MSSESASEQKPESTGVQSEKKPYDAPRIISAEDLEAAAAVCAPPTAMGPGKAIPVPCGTLGS